MPEMGPQLSLENNIKDPSIHFSESADLLTKSYYVTITQPLPHP